MDGCRVESNGADGIRFLYHDAIPEQKVDGIETFDLCTVPITPSQIYPIRLSVEQNNQIQLGKDCRQVRRTFSQLQPVRY